MASRSSEELPGRLRVGEVGVDAVAGGGRRRPAARAGCATAFVGASSHAARMSAASSGVSGSYFRAGFGGFGAGRGERVEQPALADRRQPDGPLRQPAVEVFEQCRSLRRRERRSAAAWAAR